MRSLSFLIAMVCLHVLATAPRANATDFSTPIVGLDNEPAKSKDKDGAPEIITLGTLCTNALLASYEDERNLGSAEKIARFKLALKLNDGNGHPVKDLMLNATEVALIIKLAGKFYGPLAVGRITQALDPESLK